ncbi:hypothetical protein INR49_005761 [Caranx melampygus]|nr:hypothetical protein INR49_005761 [Caranx melampygus]
MATLYQPVLTTHHSSQWDRLNMDISGVEVGGSSRNGLQRRGRRWPSLKHCHRCLAGMSQSLAEVCADFNRVLWCVQPRSKGSQITKQQVPPEAVFSVWAVFDQTSYLGWKPSHQLRSQWAQSITMATNIVGQAVAALGSIRNVCETGGGGGSGVVPHLVNRAGVQAERRWVQTGGGVTEVRLFNPQEGGTVLALLAFAVVAALVAHQEHGDEEDAEDGEGVEEDKVEEGVVGAHH